MEFRYREDVALKLLSDIRASNEKIRVNYRRLLNSVRNIHHTREWDDLKKSSCEDAMLCASKFGVNACKCQSELAEQFSHAMEKMKEG